MSIDDKSLVLGLGIGFALPFVISFIAILVSQLIEKIRDSIADRELGLIKENTELEIEVSQLRNKIRELEKENEEKRKDT